MDELKSKQILHFAVRAGEIMLQSGAETYRVEDTISRILKSHSFHTVETFVIPTCIITTIDHDNIEPTTFIKRIKNRSTRLDKIALINTLSRQYVTHNISTLDALEEVEEIDRKPSYKPTTIIGATGLSSGFFSLMVGGNYIDFIPALIIGFLIAFIKIRLENKKVTSYLIYFITGFTIGTSVVLATWLVPILNVDPIVIASIMPLVPGVTFTNAIRDMIGDELISGLSKGAEALFIAVSIAAGVGIAMNIFSSIGGFAL